MSFDEQGWIKFSSLGETEFEKCEFKEELLKKCGGNVDIAWVVYHHNGSQSLKWMNSKIPALGNKSPSSMVTHKLESLKKVLWSFPG